MTDRELLELAAKAAGKNDLTHWTEKINDWDSHHHGQPALHPLHRQYCSWNPLIDDGETMRLAISILVTWKICDNHVEVTYQQPHYSAANTFSKIWVALPASTNGAPFDDVCAAVRRAIVLAAAEIGKAMS